MRRVRARHAAARPAPLAARFGGELCRHRQARGAGRRDQRRAQHGVEARERGMRRQLPTQRVCVRVTRTEEVDTSVIWIACAACDLSAACDAYSRGSEPVHRRLADRTGPERV
eukprot:2531798-Prymnesium_polylepis.1